MVGSGLSWQRTGRVSASLEGLKCGMSLAPGLELCSRREKFAPFRADCKGLVLIAFDGATMVSAILSAVAIMISRSCDFSG